MVERRSLLLVVVVALIWVACSAREKEEEEEVRRLYAEWFKQEREVSVEATVAALLEAVVGDAEENSTSSFWVLREGIYPPAGVCVVGSEAPEIDGWYELIGNVSGAPAFRRGKSSLHVSRFEWTNGLRHWFLSDLRNVSSHADDVDYLRTIEPTNATLPPGERAAWARVDPSGKKALGRVPFVLLASRGDTCERASAQGIMGVVNALEPPKKSRKDEEEDGATVALVGTAVTGIATLAFFAFRRLARGLLRRNLLDMEEQDRAQQIRLLNEDREDGLGAPPQPRLEPLLIAEVPVVVGREEEEEDPWLEDRRRREAAGQVEPLIALLPWRLPRLLVSRLAGPWRRAALGAVLRAAERYLTESVDVSKPLLVLVSGYLVLVVSRDDFEDTVRASVGLEGTTLVVASAVVAASFLDLFRRASIAAFKLVRFLGLGRLRDQEAALLRKLVLEETAGGIALCVVAVCDTAPRKRRGDAALATVAAAFATLAASALGVLSRLARARLAHLVTAPTDLFWDRALTHVRLFSLLLTTQLAILAAAIALVRAAYDARGPLAALQLVALAARASKRTTQALAHHCALAVFELGPALSTAYARVAALVFGAGRARRLYRPPSPAARSAAFGVATYYVEYLTDVLELSLVLVWYAVELVSGASRVTTGSVLFSVFAQQAHSRLRARVSFHRQWVKARAALQARSLFQVATPDDITAYDDCCVVCLAPLAEEPPDDDDDENDDENDGGDPPRDRDRVRRTHHVPVKLPCGHILHLACLQLYVDTSHSRSTNLECPVCRNPLAPPEHDAPTPPADVPADQQQQQPDLPNDDD